MLTMIFKDVKKTKKIVKKMFLEYTVCKYYILYLEKAAKEFGNSDQDLKKSLSYVTTAAILKVYGWRKTQKCLRCGI